MSVFQRSDHNLCFLYGANLDPAKLADRCGKPSRLGIARLANCRIAFFEHSAIWDGGYETIVPQAGSDVWGVLYRMSFGEADRLDAWQDVRSDGCGAYFLYPMTVEVDGGVRCTALIYIKDRCGEPGLPSDAQMKFIVQSAARQGLPSAYIERLTGLETRKAGYPVPKHECSARNVLSSVCHGCG